MYDYGIFILNRNHILDILDQYPTIRDVSGFGQHPRGISLDRVYFAIQGLKMRLDQIIKCFATFSGLALWNASTSRITPSKRAPKMLNPSHYSHVL